MIVKNLVQHGNSKALIIDKSILQAAGLNEDTLFQIVVDSNFGVTIQSVKPVNSKFKQAKEKVLNKHYKIFKELADL
ncbi:MAG: AbrB/MazE/SpoVT family DNA-binding domain-containing protein [Parachlamydiaceae bacterium]